MRACLYNLCTRSTGVGWILLVALGMPVFTSPADATTLSVFGPMGPLQSALDPTPPPPGLPAGLTFYAFNANSVYQPPMPGLPSPNVLPLVGFAENPLSMMLTLVDLSPVAAAETFQFAIDGGFWSVSATLMFSPHGIPVVTTDEIGLSGSVTHLIAPHPGEAAPGPVIDYGAAVSAGSRLTLSPRLRDRLTNAQIAQVRRLVNQRPPEARFGLDIESASHSPHEDVVATELTALVPGFFSTSITGWTAGVFAVHVAPEPSGFVLFGSAALLGAGLLGALRRKTR